MAIILAAKIAIEVWDGGALTFGSRDSGKEFISSGKIAECSMKVTSQFQMTHHWAV